MSHQSTNLVKCTKLNVFGYLDCCLFQISFLSGQILLKTVFAQTGYLQPKTGEKTFLLLLHLCYYCMNINIYHYKLSLLFLPLLFYQTLPNSFLLHFFYFLQCSFFITNSFFSPFWNLDLTQFGLSHAFAHQLIQFPCSAFETNSDCCVCYLYHYLLKYYIFHYLNCSYTFVLY